MFKHNLIPSTVCITRVRNGFILRHGDGIARGTIDDPYVFVSLDDVRDFLVNHNFEITEE